MVLQAGARVRVPLGQFDQVRSPLTPPTEVNLLDIALEADAALTVPLAAGHSAFVMLVHGTVSVNGQRYNSEDAGVPVFRAGATMALELRALQGKAKVVVFSGEPLHQPVHWRGSLALASELALAGAAAAFQRGEFGQL